MARIWSCGFELQSATSGMEWDTTTGSPTINTTTKRSGAASLRCNPTAATAFIQQAILAADTTTAHYILRANIYIASAPSARTTLIGWSDSTYTVGIALNTNLTLVQSDGTAVSATTSSALSLNTWYRLELDYNDSTNVMVTYLDGVQFDSTTGTYDVGGGHLAYFGVITAATTDIYFDDLAVNDTTGTAQTGLPGAGQIVHLKPNAVGDNFGFATATGGTAGAVNNFTRVSETTPDDTTTYNNTTATGTTTTDDFNVTDTATAGMPYGSMVTLVQVGQRAGSSATTTASIVTRLTGMSLADRFLRTVSSGWGTADTGDLWTTSSPGGSAADFSVNGSAGLMSSTNINNSRWATVPFSSATVDFKCAISTDVLAAGGSHFVNLVARYADTDNCYLARLAFNADQTLTLTLRKRVTGTETLLATDATNTTGLVHAANRVFWVRFALSGTSLSAKVWQDGTAEPATFGATVTDASITAAGAIGIRTILSTTNSNTLPVGAAFGPFRTVGAVSESASIPVNTTTFNTHATAIPKLHKLTSYTNPQTAAAWTTAGLDNMQVGYRSNVSQSTQRRISTIWALAEYLPPIAAAATLSAATALTAGAATIKPAAATLGAGASLTAGAAVQTWLNANSGIGVRNGTSSHTVSFSFTSTAGNLLVFLVAGAVTHTDPSGTWTEQLQPVSGCELSVFTKISTADTSITVDHNGSNYPVVWDVYEFPAGSTYLAGTSNIPSAGTSGAPRSWGDTLTGLPGTSVTVIAAASSGNTGGGSVTVTAAWSAPYTSATDVTAPAGSGTDGVGMVVGTTVGYTSTTAQPTWTPTWSTGLSGWAPDVQQVLFAIAPPAAGQSGSATLSAATSLTADGTAIAVSAATLSAVASLTVAGTATGTAAATLAAASSVVVAGTVVQPAAATLTAGATLTAAGTMTGAGAATMTAGTSLTATAVQTAAGSATLTAVTALTAAATRAQPAAVTLTAGASLTAAANQTWLAAATLAAATALNADAARIQPGAATLAAIASLTAGAVQTGQAAVALSAITTLSGTGTAIVPGAVVLAAASTLTADASVISGGTGAILGAVTSLTAGAVYTGQAAAVLAAAAVLSSDAVGVRPGVATLSAITSLTADGIREASAVAALSAIANLTADGSITGGGTSATLSASSLLTADALQQHAAQILLAAGATLTASASTERLAAVVMAAIATLTATVYEPPAFYRPGILTPGSSRSKLTAGQVRARLTAASTRGPT